MLPVPTQNESAAAEQRAVAHDVHYGQAYYLRVSLKEPTDVEQYAHAFYVHSCAAISNRASVEVIDLLVLGVLDNPIIIPFSDFTSFSPFVRT